ncbi:MAG: hypothetical protein RL516_1509 [Bacteroidota bacterium]
MVLTKKLRFFIANKNIISIFIATMALRNKFIYVLAFLILVSIFNIQAQNNKPDFGSPVNIPISLSGNFCEIRSNHFHSGIDIRTNGKEGLPIFSIGDGYVSRIKVSPTGFGRVVYINHPEGYTSVYAHLSSFSPALDAFVDSIQKANESYDMEEFPDAKKFKIKKGDCIGYSGNSGSSASPHLHFEIRDLKSEEPLNPLAFFNYEDSIPPVIKEIRAVELIDNYNYLVSDTMQTINKNDTVINYLHSGKYHFEIKGTDNSDDSYGNYYSILATTLVGDTLYSTQYDRFNFDETRLVNASINYASLVNSKTEWIRLYTLPVNKSILFKKTKSNPLQVGNELQKVIFSVADFNGNTTSDTILLIGSKVSEILRAKEDIICRYYDESFTIPFKYGFLNIPLNGIDQSLCYALTDYDTIPDSTTFLIGDPCVPLLKNATVVIQKKLDNNYWLCERNNKNELTGTSFKLDSAKYGYQTTIKRMGWYSVEIDTVAPQLVKVTSEADKIIKDQKNTLLKISDDISGVKKANIYINENYLPCEFDLKRSLVVIKGNQLKKGDVINLKMIDYQGNSTMIEKIITY